MAGKAFVHRDRVALADVDLSEKGDVLTQDLFSEECDGVCGA
jgi:hypothetical protein